MGIIQNKIKKIISTQSPLFRQKRLKLFSRLIKNLPKPVKIADIGGTNRFWQKTKFYNKSNYRITTINPMKQSEDSKVLNIKADGRFLDFIPNKKYDISFSNSTLEHLYTWQDQVKMSKEIKRISRYYFIQTPNYYFPIEPHFHLPFFQFLPKRIRVKFMKSHFFQSRTKTVKPDQLIKNINSINLLTEQKLKNLFPESTIKKEKYFGLTKSFIAYSL